MKKVVKNKSRAVQKKQVRPVQPVETTEVTQTPPGDVLTGRPVNVRDARSAKRLLGRLIVALQKGEIKSALAKDLCYLLSVFVQIAQVSDFEERLAKLENPEKESENAEGVDQAA